MYIVDFMKRVVRKENLGVLIYFVLNVLFIGVIVQTMFEIAYYWQAFLIGTVAYGISLILALSPVGEALLRFLNKCKKIKRVEYINRLDPIYKNAYAKAKRLDPSLPNDIKLYLNNDDNPNAFATGRKTICVNKGLLQLPDKNIEAILCHEFAHISHKDTDLILIVSVGNIIVTIFLVFCKIIAFIVDIILAAIAGDSSGDYGLSFLLVLGFELLWTKIGLLLVQHSSRKNEYEADEFAFNAGYGDELCETLDNIDDGYKERGLFASLVSSHPETDDRIARMQALGVKYRTIDR